MHNAYDRRLLARAAAIAVGATAVTLLVVAATDEGGPWAMRVGMTSAIAPVAGAIGALGAARVAEARGELRALAAVGVDPARAVLGAMLGGAAVGLLGATLAALGIADLAALFPRPPEARVWVRDGADLRELTLGLRVGTGGVLSLEAPSVAAEAVATAGAGLFGKLMIAAAAIACPVWAVLPGGSTARRATVGAAAVVAAIAAFQGVAAGHLAAAWLLVAPTLLVTDAAVARYRARPR